MLKITSITNANHTTLVLEGQLAEPWLSELERIWGESQMSIPTRTIVVDLKDVTVISQSGENILFRMMAGGVEFNCCRGILTKHVLQQLKQRCKAQSRKAI